MANAWRVTYSTPETWKESTAIVLDETILGAIKKASRKLKLGPFRIQSVSRMDADAVVRKA